MNSEQNTNEAAGGGSGLNVQLGWIAVDDALPEYEINVLIAFESGEINIGSISDAGDGWMWAVASHIGGDLCSAETLQDDEYLPTHWMPIPDNPNA